MERDHRSDREHGIMEEANGGEASNAFVSHPSVETAEKGQAMAVARDVMVRYREVLKELAK